MAPQVNGEIPPSSATLSHLTGYPVVHDGIAYFKKNPYGQKSIELSDSAYQTFAKSILPYLNKPYQYVSPYVKKADAIGDDTLSRIDERLPVLKKPTDELVSDGKAIVFFPVRKGMETKGYVIDIYNSEYKKVGGDGLVTSGKALISTGLFVTSEALSWVGDILRAGKVQAKEAASDSSREANN
ncbi:hypothetical protein EKO27_g4075 [Xylaria grammica]|uniref:CAP20 n=1 Tax=Xylaria grammica TaxID=363999 RepID=A0A439D9G0_9PEZI|nr:hypothetical protein F5X98DRAFT_326211 [Xylaria grammica]RWA11034.1 hypothetical protein EKO27_g4075 [Xylaria grammica]GAW15781.1 hypothetical protein ANO14919_052010 [Xylariales sp. No.14919]